MLKSFQSEWKIAKVTPLFKKGSRRELENYRPISVLPLISKIFEKNSYSQYYDYLQDNRLLNTYQSGFRSMHSTLTALLETTNNWSINIDNGLLNGVLFIDLKTAFDTIMVDHEIILRKLANYGVVQSALRFFASYLCNKQDAKRRHLHQRADEHKSSSSSIGKHFRDKHSFVPKDLTKNFNVLMKCANKFECLVYEMFFINKLKPTLNVQSDSIRAKVVNQLFTSFFFLCFYCLFTPAKIFLNC